MLHEIDNPHQPSLSIDGRVHIYEVKKSFAGINKKQTDTLIKTGRLLRPDVIGYAVPQAMKDSTLSSSEIKRIKIELAKVEVDFRLITADSRPILSDIEGIPRLVNEQMDWNIW